ncbi:CidA/LrgA family protein [Thalassomonas sp. M1454]|uniref:CidA/LrgA family protein n=1 Tax=Thalassomonas sp. M1454 TaxID=2594477 RepID=UPI00117E5C8D|nr:CidA/LrgA family protein [Thalassomonas sp. M1454]TRX55115.1 CidA/LrgA family protein [Thalassomonas sp. M1454]
MPFILGFALLILFQFLGEVVVILLELPVSGPVVGLVLLLLTLIVRGRVGQPLQQVSSTLLGHLSLLFVPAGVGLMLHYELLVKEWFAISLALIIGTVIMLVCTALCMSLTNKLFTKGD